MCVSKWLNQERRPLWAFCAPEPLLKCQSRKQAIEAIKRFNAANGTASKQVTEKPKETIASLTKRVQALENTVEKLLETIQQLSEK